MAGGIHFPAMDRRDRLIGLCGADGPGFGTSGLVNCRRCLQLLAEGAGRSVVSVHEEPERPRPQASLLERLRTWWRNLE